jgi:hypothetical protein
VVGNTKQQKNLLIGFVIDMLVLILTIIKVMLKFTDWTTEIYFTIFFFEVNEQPKKK